MNYKKLCLYMMSLFCGSLYAAEAAPVKAIIFRDVATKGVMNVDVHEALGRGVCQTYRHADGKEGCRILAGFEFVDGTVQFVDPKEFLPHNGEGGSVKGSVCVLAKLPEHTGDKLEFIVRMPSHAVGSKGADDIRYAERTA